MGNDIKYDPVTGQPVTDGLEGGPGVDPQLIAGFDPETGQPIQIQQPVQHGTVNFDPATGQPILMPMQQGPANFDPMTGQPLNPQIQQGQPVQMQQPMPPQMQQVYVQPLNQQQRYVTPNQNARHPDETNPEAKKLLIVSLIAFVVSHVVTSIGTNLFEYTDYDFSAGFVGIAGLSYLASIVLMIILRVKYPKNTGGKVLMIVMLIEIVLAVLLVVVLFATCYYVLESCI